jgi:hypothetical protein
MTVVQCCPTESNTAIEACLRQARQLEYILSCRCATSSLLVPKLSYSCPSGLVSSEGSQLSKTNDAHKYTSCRHQGVPDLVEESAEGSDLEYGVFVGLSLLGNSD